jgi:hypothetical protein
MVRLGLACLALPPVLAACAPAQAPDTSAPVAAEAVNGMLFVAGKRGNTFGWLGSATIQAVLRRNTVGGGADSGGDGLAILP